MILLSTENLTKKYGKDEAQIVALDRVSISVEKGEFVSVMGASGSGKSTLLHLLGGLDDPTEGRVLYYNTDLEQMENIFDRNDEMLSEFRLRTVGFIFQSYNLVPELTVRENILLPRAIAMEEQEDDRMAEIVERLGLSDRLDYLPCQLSGGQQQRTAIARALVNQPEILLCDEPTGNLDSRSGENVMELLKMLNSEYKITIIMITHDPLLAGQTTRTIRISDGRIV